MDLPADPAQRPRAAPDLAAPKKDLILLWLVLALSVRLLISNVSFGSDDASIWTFFAHHMSSFGVSETYRSARWEVSKNIIFNHPPLPALWALLAYNIAGAIQLPFTFVFRLLPILADCVTLFILARYTRHPWIAVVFALDPISILISGFHTNTDSVYACLALLACVAVMRQRDYTAGLLFGAALNIKLIPLVVLLPLVLALPRHRSIRVMLAALPWALPYLIGWMLVGDVFLQRIFGYGGQMSFWGTGFFTAKALVFLHSYSPTFNVDRLYFSLPAYTSKLVLGAVLMLGLFWRSTRRRSDASAIPPPTEPSDTRAKDDPDLTDSPMLPALSAALFFTITPAFATQYTVLLAPLLLLASPRFGLAWVITCGAFDIAVYWNRWNGAFPASSRNTGTLLTDGWGFASLAPWSVCTTFVILTLLARIRGTKPSSSI